MAVNNAKVEFIHISKSAFNSLSTKNQNAIYIVDLGNNIKDIYLGDSKLTNKFTDIYNGEYFEISTNGSDILTFDDGLITLQEVELSNLQLYGTPTLNGHAVNKKYVDDNFKPKFVSNSQYIEANATFDVEQELRLFFNSNSIDLTGKYGKFMWVVASEETNNYYDNISEMFSATMGNPSIGYMQMADSASYIIIAEVFPDGSGYVQLSVRKPMSTGHSANTLPLKYTSSYVYREEAPKIIFGDDAGSDLRCYMQGVYF